MGMLITLVIVRVLLKFFVLNAFLLIPGLLMMLFATKGSIIYCIGIALILFDLAVVIIDEIKTAINFRRMMKGNKDLLRKFKASKDGEDISEEEMETISKMFGGTYFSMTTFSSSSDNDEEFEDPSEFKEVFDEDEEE